MKKLILPLYAIFITAAAAGLAVAAVDLEHEAAEAGRARADTEETLVELRATVRADQRYFDHCVTAVEDSSRLLEACSHRLRNCYSSVK